MSGLFTVRLANEDTDQHITQQLSDFSWRSVVPGGYSGASFNLERPISVKDRLMAPYSKVFVYDARNGKTLFEGRLQQPARSAEAQGEVWGLTAAGGSAHALELQRSLVYVDRDLTSMYRNNSFPAGESGINNDPSTGTEEAISMLFPNGVGVNTNSNLAMIYDRIAQAGMLVGGITYNWDTGFTNAAFEMQSVFTPSTVTIGDAANTTGGSRNGLSAGASIGTNHTTVTLRLIRVSGGALTISGDATWGTMNNISIRGQLVDKTGTPITGAGTYANAYVLASEVVADLLGRMLPQFDGPSATIATTSQQIDQLAYADPVSAGQVLDDLMKLEAAYYWAAWESHQVAFDDKYRFEWKAWPTTARYEASIDEGFSAAAPSDEQYNEVIVRWKDARGRIRATTVTSTVAELDHAGITRTGFLDISDEAGSAANATRAGTLFLQDHNRAPTGATLTLVRPIIDVAQSRKVMPWEIKPGELIRVRGIEASIDTLASDRDGLTVFRIVSVEVDDSGVARLELDMFSRTEARALAELLTRRRRRR